MIDPLHDDADAIRIALDRADEYGLTVEIVHAALLAAQRGATIQEALWAALYEWDI